MKTFSLLQRSLDQTIGRDALEHAVHAVPSIARADCARMHRECFGIFVSNLERSQADAFRMALDRQGFPTDLIADSDIPKLPDAYTVLRLDIEGLNLIFTDAMGRDFARPLGEVTFIAGAFLAQTKSRSVLKAYGKTNYGGHEDPTLNRDYFEQSIPEFRIDVFFNTEPLRFRMAILPNTTLFFRNEPLSLRHEAVLLHVMKSLAAMLPPDRSNQGLKRGDATNFYQNLSGYEREIRWHLYRLNKGARSS